MEHVQPTCREKDCHLWNKGKCPFSLETWWKPLEGQPKLIRDCAMIRSLLMIQELYNRQIGLQAALESQRNEAVKIFDTFRNIAERIQHRQVEEIEHGPKS